MSAGSYKKCTKFCKLAASCSTRLVHWCRQWLLACAAIRATRRTSGATLSIRLPLAKQRHSAVSAVWAMPEGRGLLAAASIFLPLQLADSPDAGFPLKAGHLAISMGYVDPLTWFCWQGKHIHLADLLRHFCPALSGKPTCHPNMNTGARRQPTVNAATPFSRWRIAKKCQCRVTPWACSRAAQSFSAAEGAASTRSNRWRA